VAVSSRTLTSQDPATVLDTCYIFVFIRRIKNI
jgi:hypothetical protein